MNEHTCPHNSYFKERVRRRGVSRVVRFYGCFGHGQRAFDALGADLAFMESSRRTEGDAERSRAGDPGGEADGGHNPIGSNHS